VAVIMGSNGDCNNIIFSERDVNGVLLQLWKSRWVQMDISSAILNLLDVMNCVRGCRYYFNFL
jgi:hypothetical protein